MNQDLLEERVYEVAEHLLVPGEPHADDKTNSF
jgi:hypothetical protein